MGAGGSVARVGAVAVAGAPLVLEGKGNGSRYGGVEASFGSGVGAVIAAGLCGCGLATVSVGGREVESKGVECLCGDGGVAPFSAGGFKEASVADDGVAGTYGGGSRNGIMASAGEGNGIFELGEDGLNGILCGPGSLHGDKVSFEFNSCDGAISFPEVVQKLKAGGVAPANGVVKHGFDIEEGDSCNQLVAEGLVGLLVETVGFLIDKVLAVEFGDFGVTRASWMVGLRSWVDRNIKLGAGDEEVGFGRNSQGKVAMASVAAMGVDGGGV